MASSCGSNTTTMELEQLPARTGSPAPLQARSDENLPAQDCTPPETATEAAERWNGSSLTFFRVCATFWSFLVMGMNDAAYGAIIPYLETYYHLSYIIVSLVFFSPLVGYAAAAFLNNWIHMRFGQRGVAIVGPLCHMGAYVGMCCHPRYPVLVVFFLLAGFGNGMEEAGWNAWVGGLANPNEVLGFLHGFYGAGAVLSPLVATALITKAGWQWYMFYYLMTGAAVLELVLATTSFWTATGKKFRSKSISSTAESGGGGKSPLKEALSARVCWVSAVFLLVYVGIEVALGGWIVTFMIRVRDGAAFESGIVATGFWIGITVGRVALGFVTPRIGEKLAVALYVPAAIGFQLLFWLVPQFAVSATAVALEGFFLGPLFPAVVVATTKALPRHLHVTVIGFVAAVGGSGAAILPFAVGVLAQAKGVQVLQPMVVALLAVALAIWALMPREKKRNNGEDIEGSAVTSGVDAWRRNVSSYVTRSRTACAKLLKVR